MIPFRRVMRVSQVLLASIYSSLLTVCSALPTSPAADSNNERGTTRSYTVNTNPDVSNSTINENSTSTEATVTSTDKSIKLPTSLRDDTHPPGTTVRYTEQYQPTLCSNLSANSHGEGRSTTPPYKRLIESINNQLKVIIHTSDAEARIDKLENLQAEVTELNNGLLPDDVLRSLCDVLTTVYTSADTDLASLAVDDWNSQLEELKRNYDYTVHREKKSDEQRLLAELMTNYEKSVRPVLKASEPVELGIGLTLNQIDVDEKNQVLTVLVWLDQEWVDEKMIWDPANYSSLEMLRIPCHLLWLPDIVLYNSVEDLREGYMQALAMVMFDGTVFWPPIVKYRGNCEIAIKYFPYDDQVCKLKLGTWAYDGSQVNLTKRKDGIDLSNYQPNGEWKLLKTETVRNVAFYTCCPEPYMDVTFTIYLQRRTLYYVYNIIIPCIMLSILTLLSFWMKPDSGEKINLGLTILLAFSVFMLLIAESMPSTSFHVPIIGIYITSSMCLTSFSVVSAVFVANINHQAEGDNIVPYWIHKLCHVLGRVMCVKMVSWEERHCNIRQLAMVALTTMKGSPTKKPSKQSKNEKLSNGSAKGDDKLEPGEDDPLLKRLHTIVEHQEELLKKQNTSDDWHAVATIIDRCLFWFYLIMMMSTIIGCIVIFPKTKVSVSTGDLTEPL